MEATTVFEAERPRLVRIAERVLGEGVLGADDEGWLRRRLARRGATSTN